MTETIRCSFNHNKKWFQLLEWSEKVEMKAKDQRKSDEKKRQICTEKLTLLVEIFLTINGVSAFFFGRGERSPAPNDLLYSTLSEGHL